jgi:hypothetical protein
MAHPRAAIGEAYCFVAGTTNTGEIDDRGATRTGFLEEGG